MSEVRGVYDCGNYKTIVEIALMPEYRINVTVEELERHGCRLHKYVGKYMGAGDFRRFDYVADADTYAPEYHAQVASLVYSFFEDLRIKMRGVY